MSLFYVIGNHKLNSINHHYLPQCYLNGFTDERGKLHVYDKKYTCFKKDKQTPRTVFFEKHKNTIEFHGESTDKIEKLYGTFETQFGSFFNSIRNGISSEELISKDGIYLIKLFIAIQFWRMPIMDEFSEYYLDNINLKDYGDRITINKLPLGDVAEISDLLKSDKGFRHYFRCFLLPLLMFDCRVHKKDFKAWKLHNVTPASSNWKNILTCDNPIIMEDFNKIFSFESKLIFPLSSTQIITYSPNYNKKLNLDALFTSKLSMGFYSQSQQYLAGTERQYMEDIIEIYNSMYGKNGSEQLRRELFSYI